MITADDIDASSLTAILLDEERRAELLRALDQERGSDQPLTDALSRTSAHLVATPEQLREIVERLLPEEDQEWLIGQLVFHPDMPEDVLFELLEAGLCIDELGHRRGPRALLERVIELHDYDEAILTVALDLFQDPEVGLEEFTSFVERHKDHSWMMGTLVRAAGSDPAKELVVESLLEGHDDAILVRGRELVSSPEYDFDHLKAFLERFSSPELIADLVNLSTSNEDKRSLIDELAPAQAEHESVSAALILRERLLQARDEAITRATAEELLATGDPQVLLALSDNPKAPVEVLERLSEASGFRHARKIRGCAKRHLLLIRRRSKRSQTR